MRYNNVRAITLFVSLLSGLDSVSCRAQPPAPPPPGPAAFGAPPPPPRGGRRPLPPGPAAQGSRTTLSGVVRSFNYGPGGLDGLILDRGTVVHFPPEYSSQVSAAAPIGSAVAASGWSHIGPAGDTLFDADTITNRRSRASITMTGGPPPPPPPGPLPPGPSAFGAPPPPPRGPRPPLPPEPAAQGSRTTLSGVVRDFNYGPGGLDGLILDQGTVVHFPPEYSSQVSSAAPIGSAIAASGWSHIGPAGDALFDADTITNQSSRAAITMTAGPAAAPPPPGPAGYAEQPPAPPAPGLWQSQIPAAAPVPPTVVTGVVRRLNYGFDGQVNGFVLSDGTPIYFPPEVASRVTRTVAVGARVRVTGSLRTGPTGNRLVDAEIVTNRQNGISVTVRPAP